MSKPKSGQKVKRAGNPRMKTAWELHALMTELGFDTPEQMRAAMAAPAEQPVALAEGSVVVIGELTEPAVTTAGPPVDPLAWITPDVSYICMVSGTSTFVLRQQNFRMQPPLNRIAISSERTAPWDSCPFFIGNRENHLMDQNIKVMKSAWHHYRVRRQTAEELWGDERYPRPTHVVIGTDQYQGWDRPAKQARGVLSLIEDFVPLRELMRYFLQKAGDTFINFGALAPEIKRRLEAGQLDERMIQFPNPYRNKIEGVKVEMKPL